MKRSNFAAESKKQGQAMKKNVYILAAVCAAALAACDSRQSFTVEGSVTGAEDKTLYFEQTGLEGIVGLDSVKLDESGTFRFKGERPASPDFYRLRVDNQVVNFAVDSTETVTVEADINNFATDYRIEGSENNLKIKELALIQADLQRKVNELAASGLPAGIAQDSLRQMVDSYKANVKRNYIFAAPNTSYAYFALFQTLNGYMIFDPLTNRDDVKCFAAVATSLNNAYPHAGRSRNLYNMVIKGMKNTRPLQPQEELAIPADKIQETSIIDIPLKDIDGQVRHLTDLKGKVVLIDFTAYAAPTSGVRNLALRELYDKYAPQGFEIYQISFDTDEHFWKTASDNLPWICVRDPQGPYSSYISLYGLTQLPGSFLVNRSNELSVRLDGNADLEAEIKKLL